MILYLFIKVACVNVHYIEFINGSLFLQPTFMEKVCGHHVWLAGVGGVSGSNSVHSGVCSVFMGCFSDVCVQVVSVSIQNVTLARTSEPVTFHINSNQNIGLLPQDSEYVH